MKLVAIRSLAQWADAIAALDAGDRLADRSVLVPSEAHAHALRVALVERAPGALAGTRYLTAAAAARAVLDAARVAYEVAETQRRPLRVRKLLRSRPALASYRAEDLHAPGWETAIATTIEQLEAAALCPDDLDGVDDPRAADLATIWRWLDADAGPSWTVPRLLCEASHQLAAGPAAWPFDGAVLAIAASHRTAADARLITALPRLTLGVVPVRPASAASIERMRALFGPAAADVAASLATAVAPSEAPRELDLLAAYLFAPPAQLIDPDRRRSRGPDGTVSLELYAGTDDELDAAARWVAEQVLHGTPLQDIAILAPSPEPLATLVADRIAALPWPIASPPVYLASGRPAVTTAAGARLRAVLHAVEACLPRDEVTALLPRLRLASGATLSPGAARAWVDRLGTAGGDPGRPAGAFEWRDRLCADDPRAVELGPAIEALVAIVASTLDGAALDVVWQAVQAFAKQHLVAPRELAEILSQLDAALAVLIDGGVTAQTTGRPALAVIGETLATMRLEVGRHGEPAVYVGTVQGAAGLPFAAVRVIGLVESIYPGTLRGDPLLPPELRRRLPPHSVASDREFAAMRMHMLGEVVHATGQQLVVSAARTEGAGSEREPAGLFFDLAAALGRPDAHSSTRASMAPLFASCWLDRVARGVRELPGSWTTVDVIAPQRVAEVEHTRTGALGSAALTTQVPGLDSQLPISAGALRTLFECPHRFLLEHVLGRRPRTDPPEVHRIAPATYGDLIHRVVQTFLIAHGAAFTARSHDLEHWQASAAQLADVTFGALLDTYPLLGPSTLDAERRRLRRDVRTYLTDDWASPSPQRWIAAERSFGEAGDVVLDTAAGALYVRGRIDRIDVAGGVTLVRDLKTSRLRPAFVPAGPTATVDIQLAVYIAATEQLATAWEVPRTVVGAYTYVDALAVERQRSFAPGVLSEASQRWFEIAAGLLREQAFVRTSDASACKTCSFAAACDGPDATPCHGAAAAYRSLTP